MPLGVPKFEAVCFFKSFHLVIEGRTKPTKVTESFHIRQPEHVPLSATLGLGVFDRAKIEHLRYNIT